VSERHPLFGLLADEQRVMDLAVELWAAWLALPIEHPQDRAEVCAAVHRVQDLLAVRIARREYPEGWRRYEVSEGGG
jgi:hypothetical protein